MHDDRRTTADLIAAYRRGARVLRDALDGMDEDALRARPIEGKMSAKEVASHIVDSDQFMCDRVRRTLAMDKPLLMGCESWLYVAAFDYQDRDLELDLRLLELQREQLANDLERLGSGAWDREAVHSENGLQTLTDILEHAVEHLEDHVSTIYTKRQALGL